MTSLASLVPALAAGYERRALLRRVEGLSRRVHGGLDLETMWRALRARGLSQREAIDVLAEGGWRGWAENRAAEETADCVVRRPRRGTW